jgi:hypothetical protein
MGWKDLFKSKAPKAAPDPRLRWFGKLPTYADYYSSATDEEWAVEFNEWVLKGFEIYLTRRRDGPREARLPLAVCALRLPKSGMTVFVYVEDYGGDMRGRPFPLCFYVGVPSALWPGPTSDRILPGLRVLRDLMGLRPLISRFFNNPGRFESVFGGREIDLRGIDEETRDASWQSAAQNLSLAEWFEAARPCLKVNDLPTWLQLAGAWGDDIARLESEEFGPTLRFPLVMGNVGVPSVPGLEAQVSGWLRWLEQRMNLEERVFSLLICKTSEDSTGYMSVVLRELAADDFLLMTSQARSLSYVDDLCLLAPTAKQDHDGAQAEATVRAPERWADFVEATAHA